MKRLIVLIEVDDTDQQQFLYDVLQQMVEDRELSGYFTLVDNGKAVEDLPEYMEYERNKLNPMIANLEKDFDNLYHK
jgi:hypothetical protein